MHLVNSLYSEEYDFAVSTAPRSELMIATLPRSGSTYFCIELWKTGLLGAPLEYANFGCSKVMRKRLSDYEEVPKYWEKVKELRTSPNGIFSYKMFMYMYLEHGRKNSEMLKKFVPNKVVYLTRRDKVAQAVSYSKAIMSNCWFAGVPINKQPEYNLAHVRMSERRIRKQEDFWERVFELTQTSVFRVVYEDFLIEPDSIKARICEWVGEKFDESKALNIPNLERQSDESSSSWAERYVAAIS